jgi:4-amino-4-deoxy-L-arabinose transferase-like glycosyltransferase
MIGNKRTYLLFLALVLAVLLVDYSTKLGTHCIYIWDESIYANNALEMSVTKNLSFYTNDYVKNYFNVKPPLVIILQALSIGMLGYSELALRLPTLLFFVGSIFLLVYYSKKLFSNITLGLEASVFLILCVGAIRPHVFLSGDLDAGLVFFSLLLLFNHLDVCENKQLTNRHWFIYFLAITLGWFCKSTAIFLMMPALFVVSVFYRNVKLILKDGRAYITLSAVILIIASYYIYKYNTDPYYVQLVWETEYMRLVKNIMPWHAQPFSYYFINTFKHFALIHWLTLCITLLIGLHSGRLSKIQKAFLLVIVLYLLTISIPTVKLEWYDAFIYPVLCLLLSSTIYRIVEFRKFWLRLAINIFVCLVMFLFFEQQTKAFYSTLQPQELEGDFLKNNKVTYPALKVLKKVEDDKTEHYNVVKFYLKRNRLTQPLYRQQLVSGVKEVSPLDTVLCCSKNQIDSLKSLYKIVPIQKRENCVVFQVLK